MYPPTTRRTAVVIGGASGIGQAAVRQLIRQDDIDVVVLDCDTALSEALVSRFDSPRLTSTALDVTDPIALASTRDAISDAGHQIAAVIHCVGFFSPTRLLDISVGDWQRCIEVNLNSAFHVCRTFLPAMLTRRNGHLVVIASAFGGNGPASGFGAYATAKSAVIALVQALAAEVSLFGVSVNAVSPGVLATPMLTTIPSYEKHAEDIGRLFPLSGQVGDPADVAKLACALATGELGWITGQNFVIDGGYGANPLFELVGISLAQGNENV